jgi:hypothetical protein
VRRGQVAYDGRGHECVHGMNPEWCAVCQRRDHGEVSTPGNHGYFEGRSKQDLLNQVSDRLGLVRESVGVGSSLPSNVFDTIAKRFGIPDGSMPEIGAARAGKAGRSWALALSGTG